MKDLRTPARWVAEPDPAWPRDFVEALSSYAQTGPDELARARMSERIENGLRSAPSAAVPWLRFWLAASFLVVGAAAIGFGHAVVNLRRANPAPSPSAPPASSIDAVQIPRSALPASQLGLETPPSSESAGTSPAVAASPAPSAIGPSRHARNPIQGGAARSQGGAARSGRSGPLAREGDPRAAAAPHVAPPSGARSAAPGTLRSELELLIRARRVLVASPARALELAAEHAARYPTSAFVQEREILAIEAEQRLGRTEAAAARARRFEQAHPDSIHRARGIATPSRP